MTGKQLTGRDLAYLRWGAQLFSSMEVAIRYIRKAAMRTPKYWVWKYGWPLVEEAIREVWNGQEVRS